MEKFTGFWLPDDILDDERLSRPEKFFLAIYRQYDRDIFFAGKIMQQHVPKSSVLRIKSKLASLGLIDTITDSETAKKEVLARKGQGDKCEWCGCASIALHEHHFPVSKKDGGTKTVRICPNCHSEYHAIIKEVKHG